MAKWKALSYEAASRLEWRSLKRKSYADLTPRYINFSDRITFIRRVRSLITNDNIVSSLWKLIEVCRLLAEPENHIKIKTGQYVEKKTYTRSEADMKAEMVKELANLPKYTAWVKTSDVFDKTLKVKTRIFSVDKYFDYNPDYREVLQKIISNIHEQYCTRRDLIEEEIRQRQARWRGGGESLTVKSEPPDKPDKPKPPSTRTRV